MRYLLIIALVCICWSSKGQNRQIKKLDYKLTHNKEKMHFSSKKKAEGNFQIKMVPSDPKARFSFSIENQERPEYSITFTEVSLKNYNYYSCILPEGEYELTLKTNDESFHILVTDMVVFPLNYSRSQCGDNDDRLLSFDPKCGRMVIAPGQEGGNCTAQLLSNGLLAMSGHCVADSGVFDLPLTAIVGFNVPFSSINGNFNTCLPQDQYPIINNSVDWEHYDPEVATNCGREWSIFQVADNAVTGLSPFEAQEDFYYLTNSSPSTSQNIQIVGYGSDFDQLIFDNVQQSHNGPNNGVEVLSNGGVIISHEADTEAGNSGSAIQRIGNLQFTYGIHNSGGCGGNGCSGNGDNSGISFQYTNLENAMNTFYGANTIHVSNVSNSIFEDGTAFRPYDTFTEGQNASSSGSENTVVLMTGNYEVADDYLLTKPMLIISPAGSSVIK